MTGRQTANPVGLILSVLAVMGFARAIIAADADEWPGWRGPFSNGSGVECGEALVGDLADAVQVWSCPLAETGQIG